MCNNDDDDDGGGGDGDDDDGRTVIRTFEGVLIASLQPFLSSVYRYLSAGETALLGDTREAFIG
jgi:hypothetical protein